MSPPAASQRLRLPQLPDDSRERARLSVVPRRRDVRSARVPFVTLVTLVLVGGVVGLLLFNTSLQQASFAATALEAQARALTAQEQKLRMELDDLRDPQRVAEQAQAMGMVPAVNPAFLDITDGSVLGEPRPATPEDGLRIRPNPTPRPGVLDPPPRVITVVGQSRAETRAERRAEQRAQRQEQRRQARGADTRAGNPED